MTVEEVLEQREEARRLMITNKLADAVEKYNKRIESFNKLADELDALEALIDETLNKQDEVTIDEATNLLLKVSGPHSDVVIVSGRVDLERWKGSAGCANTIISSNTI